RIGRRNGNLDENQPAERRNRRMRSEHGTTENVLSIDSLKHRRIGTATSQLDLSKVREIGVTKDQADIAMGNEAPLRVDDIRLTALSDMELRDNVPNQFKIDLCDEHASAAAVAGDRQDHERLAFIAKIDRPVIDLARQSLDEHRLVRKILLAVYNVYCSARQS